MSALVTQLMKEFKSSLVDYLLLFTGSILFLLFLELFQGQRLASFLVIVVFILLYIFWGILHHLGQETLNVKSVIEYILIGLTILLLLTVVFSI